MPWWTAAETDADLQRAGFRLNLTSRAVSGIVPPAPCNARIFSYVTCSSALKTVSTRTNRREVPMIDIKPLNAQAIPSALEMAQRYRLLNEPEETESICRDILAVDPHHQDALITLLLALTDKFADRGLQPAFEEAREIVAQLDSSYCKS